jgi:hypothetical protein
MGWASIDMMHLVVNERDTYLLLSAITSLQEDMVMGYDSKGSPRVSIDKLSEFRSLDDLWLRIFEYGLDAGFRGSNKASKRRVSSGLEVPDDWSTTPYGEQK